MNKAFIITIDPAPYNFGKSPGYEPLSKQNIELILESELWLALDEICAREHTSVHALCTIVHGIKSPDLSLDAAMGLFIMDYFRCAATEDGHLKAGHGTIFHPSMPSTCLH